MSDKRSCIRALLISLESAKRNEDVLIVSNFGRLSETAYSRD